MRHERGLLKLISAAIKHAEGQKSGPFQGVGDKVSRVEGIKKPGDCGPFEVTVVSSDEGVVKQITAVISQG